MSTLRKVLIASLREKVTNELQACTTSRNAIVGKKRGEGNGKGRKHVALMREGASGSGEW